MDQYKFMMADYDSFSTCIYEIYIMYININIFFFHFSILDFTDPMKPIFIAINTHIKKTHHKSILLKA